MIVVDDQLLFSVLAHKLSPALQELATNASPPPHRGTSASPEPSPPEEQKAPSAAS